MKKKAHAELPPYDHEAFKALFAEDPFAQDTLGLDYAYGFILSTVSAPDIIPPPEWLPMLFTTDRQREQDAGKQVARVLGALVSIWSFWTEETQDSETLTLPPECVLDAEGNPSAPLLDFCRGYLEGCDWLRGVWDEALDPFGPDAPEDRILGRAMALCLRIFKSDDLPDDGTQEAQDLRAVPLTEALQRLPQALTDAAALGRALHIESLRESGPVKADPKPGRNEPCPCGSGKKYKKCCLK